MYDFEGSRIKAKLHKMYSVLFLLLLFFLMSAERRIPQPILQHKTLKDVNTRAGERKHNGPHCQERTNKRPFIFLSQLLCFCAHAERASN